MSQEKVVLKPGKDKPLRQKHHWIFSGALAKPPKCLPGTLLPVYSAQGELLGTAYFHPGNSLIGRMVSWGDESPEAALSRAIKQSIAMRQQLFDPKKTNAYRLINGEGDGCPGLIVDQYAQVLVIQVSTSGMERLKEFVCAELRKNLPTCTAIYEKSSDHEGVLFGAFSDSIDIIENGLHFTVSPKEGQKTGFFLDHREMRAWVEELVHGKKVLNCFGYTGAFSVYAHRGGAISVETVDISTEALARARTHCARNGFSDDPAHFHAADLFHFLRETTTAYDCIILDPPAFAKKSSDVPAACRGYKEINRLAMQRIAPGGLLLTASCSYHVDAQLFQQLIFQAALEAKRNVRILGRHRQAADHPINVFHPEGDYLKSLLLYVE